MNDPDPPPFDYHDVPMVLKWIVARLLHIDRCLDELKALNHDAAVRRGVWHSGWLHVIEGAVIGTGLLTVMLVVLEVL